MKEFAMVLWAMTASHQPTPAVPNEPAAVVRTADQRNPEHELTDQERTLLRESSARVSRCSTGKLVYDEASGFYVPEQTANCK